MEKQNQYEKGSGQIFEPGFWKQAWNEALKSSLQARRREKLSSLDYWNRLSGQFARRAGQQKTARRVERVLAWLDQHGVLQQGMEVLDIGAGAGVFTIPLSRRGAKVTALEPAPAMLAVLQERVKSEGLTNICFIEKEWETIDPVVNGISDKFDLVFASLTPGVRDVDTLIKMTDCSRGWCFLCSFAGYRFTPAREELWRLVFDEKMPLQASDIFFPMNYLYASGYNPSFQVWVDEWDEELLIEEAVSGLYDFLRVYTEITPDIESMVRGYVEQRSVNGTFVETTRVRLGMLLWRKFKQWPTCCE